MPGAHPAPRQDGASRRPRSRGDRDAAGRSPGRLRRYSYGPSDRSAGPGTSASTMGWFSRDMGPFQVGAGMRTAGRDRGLPGSYAHCEQPPILANSL